MLYWGYFYNPKLFLIVKKSQYVTFFVAVALVCLLWIFGKTKPSEGIHSRKGHQHETPSATEIVTASSFSIDSTLLAIRASLSPKQETSVQILESEVNKSSSEAQKSHAYHRLSGFWKDSVRAFIPYAWYMAEGARLENSEKNLNFAAHLFLNNLQNVENGEFSKWMALQASDLFQRCLKVNPQNDSAKVGLGATYMLGGISKSPMAGIAKIGEVVQKDSNNLYAQMTLATGSMMSGQMDKAEDRLQTAIRIDPKNIQALLLLADIYEKQNKKRDAIKYYQLALPLVAGHGAMKVELEKRIESLKKQH